MEFYIKMFEKSNTSSSDNKFKNRQMLIIFCTLIARVAFSHQFYLLVLFYFVNCRILKTVNLSLKCSFVGNHSMNNSCYRSSFIAPVAQKLM